MRKKCRIEKLALLALSISLALPYPQAARAENATGLAHFGTSCGHLCTNADIFGGGSESARERAKAAEADGNRLGDQAKNKGRLGDEIGKDLGGLRNNLAQIPPAPAAEAQQKREALLGRSYEPKKEFREEVQKLGLIKNRDLNEKGEKVQKQVYTEAKELMQESQQKLAEAKKSTQAATQMQKLQTETTKRVAAMKSTEGTNILKAATAKTGVGTGISLASSESQTGEKGVRPSGIADKAAGRSRKDNELPPSMRSIGQLPANMGLASAGSDPGGAGKDKGKDPKEDKFLSQLASMDGELSKSLGVKLDAVQSALMMAEQGGPANGRRGPASLGGEGPAGGMDESMESESQGAARVKTEGANLFHRVHDCLNRQQKRGHLLAGASN